MVRLLLTDVMQVFEFKSLEKDYLKIFRLTWLVVILLLSIAPIVKLIVAEQAWWVVVLVYLLVSISMMGLMYWYSIYYFRAYQYRLTAAGLVIHKGVFWQQQSIVPRNRVQHIDITTGPLERRYDLSKLVVHTAGTRNATVTLPGLLHQDASELRQELINTNQTEDTV